jgi:calcium-dependent protein kinase
MLYQMDTNGNGWIDYTEFLAGCMKSKVYLREENILQAFDYFDRDHSGNITVEELRKVMCNDEYGLDNSLIEKMISECDINKDGMIDYNEFFTMMKM